MGTAAKYAGAIPTDYLEYAGAAIAYVVAALHLFHPKIGFSRLVLVLSVNPTLILSDPRPLAFVLSGFAIIAGVTAILLGASKKQIYVAGMALMLVYIVGYFAWHLSGHGGFLPNRRPLYHGLTPIEAVVAHLTTDLWAAASIVLELVLFGMLSVLYRRQN